ncbi:MAG: helix-turn-helix transcriptional regulator [Bacillota bacterium]
MKKKNLTQIEFAKIMSLANSTISQYEAGRRMPDQEILQKFADFFDVSVDYLLGRTNSPKPIGDNGTPTSEQHRRSPGRRPGTPDIFSGVDQAG